LSVPSCIFRPSGFALGVQLILIRLAALAKFFDDVTDFGKIRAFILVGVKQGVIDETTVCRVNSLLSFRSNAYS